MSNSASLSAAKRRRGGGPPVGQSPGGPAGQAPGAPQPSGMGVLPPGLPPNFRQMPPQLQQQILRQMQQRMAQMQQPQQQPMQPHPQGAHVQPNIPVGVAMSSNNMNEKMPPQVSGNGPYVVNSVLHNRAISEVDGIHIRDLPMSAAGLPCLPSGAALPPNILFKLHHDELLNQDATMNEHSNRLQMLTNRVDKIERGVIPNLNQNQASSSSSLSHTESQVDINSLSSNSDFIAKILDNILTNTNLSDIINQIEPLQKENESLRALIHSQQTTLNELSTLVMKLLNGSLPHVHQEHLHSTNNFTSKYEDIKDEFCNYVNGNAGETGETGETGQEVCNISLNNHGEQEHIHEGEHEDNQYHEDQEYQEEEYQEHEETTSSTAREV
jgi:hypothetical protein